jgi:hypothetical protein
MLEQLIQLTNSLDFVENGHFSVLEVIAPPPRNKVVFKLEALLEDPQSDESTRQVWEVTCLDVLDMGGPLDYNCPIVGLTFTKTIPSSTTMKALELPYAFPFLILTQLPY